MFELIVTGIIGLIIGVIAQKRHHDLELDRIYLAPFRRWCAEFYDELYEFKRRYLNSKVPCAGYSDIQVIDDWRALHDISAYAMAWLAKIQKQDKDLFSQLETLLLKIDKFWHALETRHQFVLENRKDIIGLGVVKQRNIATALCSGGIKLLRTKKDEKCIDNVLKYLEKKIPSENILKRFCQWIWRG